MSKQRKRKNGKAKMLYLSVWLTVTSLEGLAVTLKDCFFFLLFLHDPERQSIF